MYYNICIYVEIKKYKDYFIIYPTYHIIDRNVS